MRRSRRKQGNWPKRRRLKRRKPRGNERKSFNKSRSQGSEDRHHRGWSWFPSCPRRGDCDACGTAIGNCEHENKGDGRHVRRQTMVAERNRPCSGGLRFFTGLAWRWRCIRAASPRLFQESFEISATSRTSKSAERTNQSRRRSDDRQIRGFGNQNQDVCRPCSETN